MDCFVATSSITLTAAAAAGSVFVGWTTSNSAVGCTGTNPVITVTPSGNKNCTATFDLLPALADLEVVKSGNGTIAAGDTAIYTITVTNNGPATAENVTLTDFLPEVNGDLDWTVTSKDPDLTACSIDTDGATGDALDCDIR